MAMTDEVVLRAIDGRGAATKAVVLESAWSRIPEPTFERLVARHAAKRRPGDASEGLASFAEKRAARR